jgi:hypothetical protein
MVACHNYRSQFTAVRGADLLCVVFGLCDMSAQGWATASRAWVSSSTYKEPTYKEQVPVEQCSLLPKYGVHAIMYTGRVGGSNPPGDMSLQVV